MAVTVEALVPSLRRGCPALTPPTLPRCQLALSRSLVAVPLSRPRSPGGHSGSVFAKSLVKLVPAQPLLPEHVVPDYCATGRGQEEGGEEGPLAWDSWTSLVSRELGQVGGCRRGRGRFLWAAQGSGLVPRLEGSGCRAQGAPAPATLPLQHPRPDTGPTPAAEAAACCRRADAAQAQGQDARLGGGRWGRWWPGASDESAGLGSGSLGTHPLPLPLGPQFHSL